MTKEIKLGKLTVRWLGHASFEIFDKKKVFIDPYAGGGEKADIILITHSHFDHCDEKKIEKLRKEDTIVIAPISCAKNIDVRVIEPEGQMHIGDITIKAVEAYNIGKNFHPKGFGVGYILDMDGKKIYHAGDTDKIPEMARLEKEKIDIALLPVDGTYTMTIEEAAEAAKMIKPKMVFPMHYEMAEGTNTKLEKMKELLKGSGIEVIV